MYRKSDLWCSRLLSKTQVVSRAYRAAAFDGSISPLGSIFIHAWNYHWSQLHRYIDKTIPEIWKPGRFEMSQGYPQSRVSTILIWIQPFRMRTVTMMSTIVMRTVSQGARREERMERSGILSLCSYSVCEALINRVWCISTVVLLKLSTSNYQHPLTNYGK